MIYDDVKMKQCDDYVSSQKQVVKNREKNKGLVERSGKVKLNGRLISFLYELMRDHLPAGKVEEIIRASEDQSEVVYTNGWLAQYAEDLAKRLKDQ